MVLQRFHWFEQKRESHVLIGVFDYCKSGAEICSKVTKMEFVKSKCNRHCKIQF